MVIVPYPTIGLLLPTAREGNVFTHVCGSVHNRPHGYLVIDHPCWLFGHSWLRHSRYVSYWNAFLFSIFCEQIFTKLHVRKKMHLHLFEAFRVSESWRGKNAFLLSVQPQLVLTTSWEATFLYCIYSCRSTSVRVCLCDHCVP